MILSCRVSMALLLRLILNFFCLSATSEASVFFCSSHGLVVSFQILEFLTKINPIFPKLGEYIEFFNLLILV